LTTEANDSRRIEDATDVTNLSHQRTTQDYASNVVFAKFVKSKFAMDTDIRNLLR